jgi:thymidylate synthase
LQEDFNSEQRVSEFSQPSPELIDLRRRARLDPSRAPKAASREEQETQDAEKRRDALYHIASNQLRKHFTQEYDRLRRSYEALLSDVQHSMNADVDDLNKIIKRLEARKAALQSSDTMRPNLAQSRLPRLVPR